MPKINCPQLNRTFKYDPNLSVMKNLLNQQIPVASSCGGDGICGKCRMKVLSPAGLSPISELERKTLAKNKANPGERLSCQLYVSENIMLETTYW